MFDQSSYGFCFRPKDSCLLHAILVSLTCVCLFLTLPSLFPFLPPPTTSLSFCLQPCRRPSLQPSLDCLFAPSPHLLCHPNQQFTSQFSLCLGNSHSSSDCTFSHKPSPSLCSSSFPHQSFSCPDLNPDSSPFEKTSNNSHSSSKSSNHLKSKSKVRPSLSSELLSSPPHSNSDSQSDSSFHKTKALTTSPHCSSRQKSNSSYSHPCLFTLHSQTSPNPNSLLWAKSNVCLRTLQNNQHRSNAGVKTLLLPSFHTGFQTNPTTPLQSDSDPRPAMLSFDRLDLCSTSTLPPTDRLFPAPSTCVLPYTNSAHSSLQSLTITPHPLQLSCFEGPMTKSLKAGALHLKNICTFF